MLMLMIVILSVSPLDVDGFSVDLGNVTSATSPVVWAIGVIRDPSIQFSLLSGDIQLRSSFYRVNFTSTDPHDMVWSQCLMYGFFLAEKAICRCLFSSTTSTTH